METTLSDFSLALFIWQAFIFLTLGFWLFCLIDILRNKFEQNDKMVWVIVVLLLPILGSLLYVTIGMRRKIKSELRCKLKEKFIGEKGCHYRDFYIVF